MELDAYWILYIFSKLGIIFNTVFLTLNFVQYKLDITVIVKDLFLKRYDIVKRTIA
jgi:hypothetical protein